MDFLSNRDVYKRVNLAKAIPLDTPLAIFIEPARSCNFKCRYCYHSFKEDQIEKTKFVKNGIMDYRVFTQIIDDISLFTNKLKCIHLTGRGEPLINSKLPDMIKYIKRKDITERINIVTNGALLMPELNLDLINSGLDSIKISVQGINEDDYKKIAGVKIDYKKYVSNIKHLYLNRKQCKVYIKIADLSIKNEQDKEKFYETFSNICDGIAIEHIYDIDDKLNLNLNKEKDKSVYNKPVSNIEVCPMPFYMLNIGFDGGVIPCCYYNIDNFENLLNISVVDFWNSKKLKDFRLLMLTDKRNNKFCCNCNVPDYSIDTNDIIDDYIEDLVKYFE